MKQNIYDDPIFRLGYTQYISNPTSITRTLIWPAMVAALPPLEGKNVLDLGCGDGELCERYLQRHPNCIVGVDISKEMCARSSARHHKSSIVKIEHVAMEEFEAPYESADIVISSMAFHYVKDFPALLSRINPWIRKDGFLVFSINHPMYTSDLQSASDNGLPEEANLSIGRYFDEGARPHRWYVNDVIKYHRTLQTYLGAVMAAGFILNRVDELSVSAAHSAHTVPFAVLVSAKKWQ